jgi:hypothetical protein
MEIGRYVLYTVPVRIWSQLEGVILEHMSEYVQNKCVCFRCFKLVIIIVVIIMGCTVFFCILFVLVWSCSGWYLPPGWVWCWVYCQCSTWVVLCGYAACLSGRRCWRGASMQGMVPFAPGYIRLGRRMRTLCRVARVYGWAGCWAHEEMCASVDTYRVSHLVALGIVL